MTDFILPRLQFGRAHSLGRGRAFRLYLFCRTSKARQKKRIPLPPMGRSPQAGEEIDLGF